jgi:hypothetical protein
VHEDTDLIVSVAEGLLVNDIDPEEDPLKAMLVTGPGNGTLTLNDDGSFTYRPDADFVGTDSFTYQVNDGQANSNEGTVTLEVELRIVEVTMNLPAGWSMISLPVIPDDASVSELFPGAAVVYSFEKGAGYVRKQTLEVGKGYWILMNEAHSYTITGQPIPEYTLSLDSDGWLIIGGCTEPAKASLDAGNIGVIYRFTQGLGYQQVDESENVKAGQGYWVLIRDVARQAKLTVIP